MSDRLTAARPAWIESPSKSVLVSILILVFAAALFTEVIGIHAIFGAFLMGIVMPSNPQFRALLKERMEYFSSGFLLPLFFAFTGLRTQIGLLNGTGRCEHLPGDHRLQLATLGKLGGSTIAARWTGMNWRDSFALGALMNTRGLMRLIVLNIGAGLGHPRFLPKFLR